MIEEVKTFDTSIDRLFELDEYGKEYVYKNYTAKLDSFNAVSKYLKEKFNFKTLSDYECDYFLETLDLYREEKWKKKIRARERRREKKLQNN